MLFSKSIVLSTITVPYYSIFSKVMKHISILVVLIVVTAITLHSPLLFSQDTSALMRDADLLWDDKGEAGKVEDVIAVYKKILALDEKNYEACWKIARAYASLGDRLPGTEETRSYRKDVGRNGMRYAERALGLNPHGLEGHYYYALSLSQYSIGIGSFMTVTGDRQKVRETHERGLQDQQIL